VLNLTPKKDSLVKSARIWIDRQNMVKRIEIKEFTGNINTMTFSSIKVNQPIDDGKFTYKPDKGTEIIERTGG